MSYEADIVRALSLSPPALTAPAAVQTKWASLQESITSWRQMAAVKTNDGGGGSPKIETFEGQLARMVSIDLRAYETALGSASLGPDPRQSRAPFGTGFDFSTRPVQF